MEINRKKIGIKTPVVLIIFNRPELTRRVFEQIKKVRPSQLFIISDGARPSKKDEDEFVKITRKIVEDISWSCTVKRKFEQKNLGCKISISSGLDWVFAQVDRAIILEDDCIPNSTFFYYSEELLEKYKNNEKIMHISGSNLLDALDIKQIKHNTSYYYSFLTSVWGWATWRRAWKLYDVTMKSWPKKGKSILQSCLPDGKSRSFIKMRFEGVYKGKIDTWDYQWTYACWENHAVSISPYCNMISNEGFNTHATHTKFETKFSSLSSTEMQFPLIHPPAIETSVNNDMALLRAMYPESLIWDIILKKLPFLKKLLHHRS